MSEINQTPRACPNCGAAIKRDSRRDTSRMYVYYTPTVYTCGSVASVHWSSPLIYCQAPGKPLQLSGVMVDGGDCCGSDVYREAPLR